MKSAQAPILFSLVLAACRPACKTYGSEMPFSMFFGDERTPEGKYTLGYKNAGSSFYKSIHISYPNARDQEVARKLGVSPGGDIMIHGQPNGWGAYSPIIQLFNWTDGCVALKNSHMDIVWDAVDPGTPIEIRP